MEVKKIDSPTGIGGAIGIDLDHSGGVDIATFSKTGNNVSYYYTPTGAFKGPNGTFPSLGIPLQLMPIDLNQDGWEDLMVLSSLERDRGGDHRLLFGTGKIVERQ